MTTLPAASPPTLARTLWQAAIDLAVLSATSVTFACVLTAALVSDRLGWTWPSIPYGYARGDVLIHALLASLVVLPALVLVDRLPRLRRPRVWQDLAFVLATLAVIRLGPPDAQVFGTTWTTWEVTTGLFLLQWPIILPLTLAAALLRRLLRGAARQEHAEGHSGRRDGPSGSD